ncbi:MAG TPA: ABC-2 family transporter protein [Methylomirabilota bacterium]
MAWLRLFAVFTRIGALNELAYRANFWVQALESVVAATTVLGAVAVVFSQTKRLGDWQAWELVALIGVYFLVLGMINLVLAPSMAKFMEDVQQGTLDFTLTKPEDAQVLVSVSQVQVWKVIDILVGVGLLAVAIHRLGEKLGVLEAGAFVVALLAGGAIVYSLWIMLATLTFWFIRIENILMVFWNVYIAGRWPVTIYPGWLRLLLTVVVPIAFAVTVPAEAISGRLSALRLLAAVGLAVVMLIVSRWFWTFGLKRYSGASA